MAHATTQHASHSILAGVRRTLANWREDLERHRRFNRIYAELSSLTDRELADIGITRAQVVDVAWDAANRV